MIFHPSLGNYWGDKTDIAAEVDTLVEKMEQVGFDDQHKVAEIHCSLETLDPLIDRYQTPYE
jgi:hypothetical protein